jgi:hypothetical protein
VSPLYRQEVSEMEARDRRWRPRCHWTYVAVDGRLLECGETERNHGSGHGFVPPEGDPRTDRRMLLAERRERGP